MNEQNLNTQLPINRYRFRRWLSFALLVACIFGFIQGLSDGCILFSRVGITDCKASNPIGYWVTMAIILGISISLFFVFLSSFGQSSQAAHKQEDNALINWLSQQSPLPNTLTQSARAPLLATTLLAGSLIVSVALLVVFNGFTDWVRFSMFLFILVPGGLAIGILIRWLGEKITLSNDNIQVFIPWRGWKQWSWQEIEAIQIIGDIMDRQYRIQLKGKAGRLLLSPSSFHQNTEKFLTACHWVLHKSQEHNITIQLPPDGIETWLSSIESS